MRPLFALLLLAACAPGSVVGAPEAPEDAAPCVPDRDCLDEGDNVVVSGDDARTVIVSLPDEPVGAPVVFAWHYLGGSPEELVDWMRLERLADAGYVVIAPRSRGLAGTEWDLTNTPGNNADIALFDDLLGLVTAQYDVDRERVYATGFSAGGLFTTLLTMHRAEDLAATAPFSGGTPPGAYVAPASDLPVLVSWGGRADYLYGFDFDEASRLFADALADDGHAVVTCDHGLGHWLPDDAEPHVRAFFDDHGADPSRAWSVAPARIPSGCAPR